MFAVFSTSLSADSRSRVLAEFACQHLKAMQLDVKFFDLAKTRLPSCDAGECYGDPNVAEVAAAIEEAEGILIAAPVYNYDLGASAKGLIELTGKAWTRKVVGFLCAAGGQGSYMAPMQLANSLMLDFRTFVIPDFVYTTGDQFKGNQIGDENIRNRVIELASQLVKIAKALKN